MILNLERRWDGAYVKCDIFNVITYYVKSGTRIENSRAFVFIKQIHLFNYFR